MKTDKFILDACCGGRMFWIQKEHESVLFIDVRQEENGHIPSRPWHTIKPDMIADFRKLPFPDKTFAHIVWDPPHEVLPDGQKRLSGIITKKYGALRAETWQADLKAGFNELWRVLDDRGTLNFKFCDRCVPFKKVLVLFHTQPLYGTNINKSTKGTTSWFSFVKIPQHTENTQG